MKRRKTKIIHRNPWWDYKVDLTPISSGKETGYFYGDSHGNSMIIPITKNGKFILIKQRRYLRNRMSWEFPSGWISCGETPKQTAYRELEEESCHQAKKLYILKRFEVLPGVFKNTCYLFVAENVKKIDDCQIADREIKETAYYSFKEINNLIRKNKIWAGQTLAAWAIFKSQSENK